MTVSVFSTDVQQEPRPLTLSALEELQETPYIALIEAKIDTLKNGCMACLSVGRPAAQRHIINHCPILQQSVQESIPSIWVGKKLFPDWKATKTSLQWCCWLPNNLRWGRHQSCGLRDIVYPLIYCSFLYHRNDLLNWLGLSQGTTFEDYVMFLQLPHLHCSRIFRFHDVLIWAMAKGQCLGSTEFIL